METLHSTKQSKWRLNSNEYHQNLHRRKDIKSHTQSLLILNVVENTEL